MTKISSYYPPRATPWSRFRTALHRRWIELRAPRAIYDVTEDAGRFLKGIPWLLVPGLMWRQQGRTLLGNGFATAWFVLVVIFTVSLDPMVANVAASVAAMMHAISASAVLGVLCPHWQGFSRIVRTMVYTALLVFAIYTVGMRAVVAPLAQRVTSEGSTVMIHRPNWFSGIPWHRGEWVAYRLETGATSFDRILALPGDTIRFNRDSFEVNGRHFERLSELMPTDAEWTMGRETYFIWPAKVNVKNGHPAEILLNLAEVRDSDILGRPYRRWFWKSSNLEPLKPLSNMPSSPAP
jgi:hypothetical protein